MNIKDEIDVLVDRIEIFNADLETVGKIASLFQEEIVGKTAPSWKKEVANDRLCDFYPALVTLIDDLTKKKAKTLKSTLLKSDRRFLRNEQN